VESNPVVKDILADALAVCVDNNINVAALALAKEVTALTEAFVIPAGSITPPVVMLFDKLLVIVPIYLIPTQFVLSEMFIILLDTI
jgi:hypothetical protein